MDTTDIDGATKRIDNLADTLNRTNRVLVDCTKDIIQSNERASKIYKTQQWFLLGLTLVIAVATIAYCYITWLSVQAMNESNRIQNQLLSISKDDEKLTKYLLKDVIIKMEKEKKLEE